MMKPSLILLLIMTTASNTVTAADGGLIDDFSSADGLALTGSPWRVVSDRVMGGVSAGQMAYRKIDGRQALCLSGEVSLANNGGFLQMNVDLAAGGAPFDANRFRGVRLIVRGNGERYNVHLKTTATTMPWQSYRAEFAAGPTWQEVRLPFERFTPHRLVPALDTRRLKRLGLVAIGKAMRADLCVAEVGFYAAD